MSRPVLFAIAAAVPLLLYARTASFGFVRADDADLIAGNQPFLSDLRNVPCAFARSYFEVEGDLIEQKTYYRPVAIVSFMFDAVRAGADARAYHLTNIVLHAAVTCLLLQLALAWGARPLAAGAAALLFAAHPVNVQAVAWVAGRNDLLLALFGLLSLWAWSKGASGIGRWWLGVHTAAFALALFSKETGIFFPAIAVLHQGVAIRQTLTRAQKIALGFDAVVLAVWIVLRSRALAGTPAELDADTLRIALFNTPQLLVHAGKMLAPVRLNVAPGVDAPGVWLGVIAVLASAWAAWRFVPHALVIVGVAWGLAFLLPTLLVPGLPAYEHRAYVPLIGMAAIASLPAGSRKPHFRLKPEATTTTSRGPTMSAGAGFSRPILAAILVVFAALTYQRQPVFQTAFTYWTDAVRDAQFGPLAHVNLGRLHEAEGRLPEARREYLRALERDPNTPKAHNNLGVVLMQLDRPDLALAHFREETRRHPWNADAWFNMGLFEEMRGDLAAARKYYERAIAENAAYSPAYEKLGIQRR